MSGEGATQRENLRSGGFTPEQIDAWQAEQTQKLSDGGFNQDAINDYFGKGKFDAAPLQFLVHAALDIPFRRDAFRHAKNQFDAPFGDGESADQQQKEKKQGHFSHSVMCMDQTNGLSPMRAQRLARRN